MWRCGDHPGPPPFARSWSGVPQSRACRIRSPDNPTGPPQLQRSSTTLSPTIPRSATPSWTYSGMSSSRRKRISMGKFLQGENNLPSAYSKSRPTDFSIWPLDWDRRTLASERRSSSYCFHSTSYQRPSMPFPILTRLGLRPRRLPLASASSGSLPHHNLPNERSV